MNLLTLLIPVIFTLSSQSILAESIGEIYDTDRIRNRINTRDYSYFAFGPTSFHSLGTDGNGVGVTYGHIWETTPQAAIQAQLDWAAQGGDTAASIASGFLGANFYLTSTATSPFVGFALGYGVAASEIKSIDTVGGWASDTSLGVALFRTSTTQLHIRIRHLQIFTDNGKGKPGQSMVALGVAF